MTGRLGLAALLLDGQGRPFVRHRIAGRGGQQLPPGRQLRLDVVRLTHDLGDAAQGSQRIGTMRGQPVQLLQGARAVADLSQQLGKAFVRQGIGPVQVDQAAPRRLGGAGVAGLLQQLRQSTASVRAVRPALGQHLQMRASHDLAVADQLGQGRMGLQVVLIEL